MQPGNIQLHPTDSYAPPTLRDGECYHVFISYSSTDDQWTHNLIDQLESCGLHVCYHERDFTPGRTVWENMSECIEESQKILLVLSAEFVRSRWCLLEANMSLFRDCLERKHIVPVLLEPGVAIPLHLCYLTYLEANDPEFRNKLLKVLCTPNEQLQGSTFVPFQQPSITSGKALQPLIAFNEEGLYSWCSGQFNDMEVPDQLQPIIEDPDKYREAVRLINSVYDEKVWFAPLWVRGLIYATGIFFLLVLVACCFYLVTIFYFGIFFKRRTNIFSGGVWMLTFFSLFSIPFVFMIQLSLWHNDNKKYILMEMQKAVAQANIILSEEKVLMGCQSNSRIYLVYVLLDGCKQEFSETFSDQVVAKEMFHKALMFFSPSYASCLAKGSFPFNYTNSTGHLNGGMCFCQYVSHQLSTDQWQ